MAENPIDVIARDHRFVEHLCDALERIAESLPDRVDCILVTGVVSSLKVNLAIHIRDEEDGLFPLLEKQALPDDNISGILAELAIEHATDEGFADDIIEELECLARGEKPQNAELLGHMLRNFFEHLRRHLAWEDAIVIPMAQKRLNPDDLESLSKAMIKHRETALIRSSVQQQLH